MDKKQSNPVETAEKLPESPAQTDKKSAHKLKQADGEIGGPSGLEPTRYGDWERKGIISDF